MNFEEVGRTVKKFGKNTVAEVQKLNEIRKLNSKMSSNKKQIKDTYCEIGKRLYEQYKETSFHGFETEMQSISESFAAIADLQAQVRKVKNVILCPCCNMEVSVSEKYCPNCGNKMPELEKKEEDNIIDVEYEMEPGTEEEEVQQKSALELHTEKRDAVKAAELTKKAVRKEAEEPEEATRKEAEEPEEAAGESVARPAEEAEETAKPEESAAG